jgi:hypothetical protein
VRGDQVFGERFCATTNGITSTGDSFPDEDFFPDISSLYIDDMAEDAGANTNANPPAALYAICSYLFQFLVLAFGVDVICLSVLDVTRKYARALHRERKLISQLGATGRESHITTWRNAYSITFCLIQLSFLVLVFQSTFIRNLF